VCAEHGMHMASSCSCQPLADRASCMCLPCPLPPAPSTNPPSAAQLNTQQAITLAQQSGANPAAVRGAGIAGEGGRGHSRHTWAVRSCVPSAQRALSTAQASLSCSCVPSLSNTAS
jgi:hypothetical protein